jgi:hypothetical protein
VGVAEDVPVLARHRGALRYRGDARTAGLAHKPSSTSTRLRRLLGGGGVLLLSGGSPQELQGRFCHGMNTYRFTSQLPRTPLSQHIGSDYNLKLFRILFRFTFVICELALFKGKNPTIERRGAVQVQSARPLGRSLDAKR